MKLQIIKIFSFWFIFTMVVHLFVESIRVNPNASFSNIQLTKPSVVKIKPAKHLLAHDSTLKGKRIAMK